MPEQSNTHDRPGFLAGFLLAGLLGALACYAIYVVAGSLNPIPAHMRTSEYATIVLGVDPGLVKYWKSREEAEEHGFEMCSGHWVPGPPLGATVINYASKERVRQQQSRIDSLLRSGLPPLKLAGKLPSHERCKEFHQQAENDWLDLVELADAIGIDQDDLPCCDRAGALSHIWLAAAEATDPGRSEEERRQSLQHLVEYIGWLAITENEIPKE